ncbi:MAG: sulfite exporter TauE/SafE family protein [Pseudomonadota bacterium]|nr:sulfite exporter TauE/SafE family protein [Pseudomonadota bacterium]
MQVYLPIAELAIDPLIPLGLGTGVGLVSGLFGVGGGFLLTPLLILAGIPPTVAVATGANQVCGASLSGAMAHWRRGAVDLRMAGLLLAGGVAGSALGVRIFEMLRRLGQVELAISHCYVAFLGSLGARMAVESVTALRRARRGEAPRPRRRRRGLAQRLPLRVRFRRSGLCISVLPPLALGALVGLLAAVMGVGGGFILVPAMIYLLGMPAATVVGTSLVQIMVLAAATTVMHALGSGSVDVTLAALLLVGGVIGAQVGAGLGARLRAEQMRALLALLVLGVCAMIGWQLVATPADPFVVARAPA